MYFSTIRLRSFRNHTDTTLNLGRGTNVLVGDNGQGKTNILEAISYLCLTKSFYASSDSIVLGFGNEMFEVEGVVTSDSGTDSTLRVAYGLVAGEKVFSINRRRIEPLSSIIGRFPIVVLSPEHAPITFGGPSDRRRFIDLLISQANNLYFENLLDYRRILKHRNKILQDARVERSNPGPLIEPWTEQLVNSGATLIYRRRQFVLEFRSYIEQAYHKLASNEDPGIEYVPSVPLPADENETAIRTAFSCALTGCTREELRTGTTLLGPHRDELAFTVNGIDLRKFASQGQHKTFLIALKVGEFAYLKECRGETPVMLMDDVFSELDEQRSAKVLAFFSELGQTIITSTQSHVFDTALSFGERNKKFLVGRGAVECEAA